MTINYTTLLGLAKPVTGTETGQWGDVVNDQITTLVEDAVANASSISVTAGNVTLTTTTGSANQARMSTLIITGSPGTTRNVVAPSQAKIYVVINQSNAAVVVKGSATTGVTIGAGQTAQIAWNGSDFVEIGNYVHGNFVVNGNLSVNGNSTLGDAAGDTTTVSGPMTLSAGTANGVLYLNGSKVATSGSALTFDGTKLLASASASITGEFKTTSSTAQVFSLVASNDAGTSIGLGVFGSAAGTFGTIPAGTPFLATSAATMVQNVQNASGAFVWGIGATPAEQMRLTSTGLGIGTSSPGYKLSVNGAASGTVANIGYNGDLGTGFYIGVNHASNLVQLYASGSANKSMAFYTGATEAMRYDTSGNLGIGTSSPSYKLDVRGGVIAAGNGTIVGGISYSTRPEIGAISNHPCGFITNNTTQMLLDTSGNLGLGVTPYSGGTGWKTMDVATYAAYAQRAGGTSDAVMSWNAYIVSGSVSSGTGYRYKTGGDIASAYEQNGAHRWYTAPSGTAGNAISFTQAMTLDASGRLLVGTTTATDRRLSISTTATSVVQEVLAPSTDSATICFADLNTSTAINQRLGSIGNNLGFWTGATERARITSGGDLQTFNTFALWPSASGGAGSYSIKRAATNALTINDDFAGQERLRITSGGDFGIGNNNPQYRLTVDKDTTSALAFFTNSNASAPNGLYVDFSAASPNNATQYFLYCEDSTAQRATIRSNGGLANYQSNNVDLSDSRTKKDIAPAASMWSKIGALEIVTYKYNDQTHDDVNVGVIAQQVEQVEPVWVDSDGFGETPEDGVPLKTVYTKDITFAAIKALQEAMTRIEQLEARVAALEAA